MKILKIPGNINALVDELRILRARKKEDEKAEATIVTTLKEFAEQAAASLQFNSKIVAMLEEKSSSRIDSEKLRASHPLVAAECSVTSNYLTIKLC